MRRFLFVIAVVVASVGLASAQEITTGTIEGTVVDSQGLPVPGAAVSVVDSGGTAKTFFTDGEGRFFAPFLTPDNYSVRVDMSGFQPIQQDDVLVVLGRRTELAMTIEPGGVTEVVRVTGTVKAVDLSSTTAGVVLGEDQLQRIPVGRRVTDTLFIAPGVSGGGRVGGGSGDANANPSIAGGSGLENNYIVDGVNITNAGYGGIGSYSIVFGSLGSGVTFDFIKEVQVKTAGYEAEYGQASGGVVNVITKSGSNVLRGSAFGYFRPSALEGDWTQVTTTNATRVETVNTTETHVNDIGFEVGGAAIRDKLFFFGAANPQWETKSFIAPEGFALRNLGAFDRARRVTTYAAKATYQLTSSHRIDASFFGDPAHGNNGPQQRGSLRAEDTSRFSEIDYGGHNQVVKYDGIMNNNWLLEASFARASNRIQETPSVNEWSVTDQTVTPNVRTGGLGFFEVGNEGQNLQYSVKSTHLFGDHQIRTGILYEDISYDNTINRTGPTFTLPDGRQTVTGATLRILPAPELASGRLFRVVRANTNAVRTTTQQYLSFFIQDTIKVGNRLTFRPGVRYEQQELVGNLDSFKWDGNWAPRIGGTFDLTGNGKAKVYANYGRFYAKIPNDLAARALSADEGVTRADYFDANLTQPILAGQLAGGTTTHFRLAGQNTADFDPNAGSTYLNEYLVGVEFEALPGMNVGVRYTHRDFGRIIEDIGTPTMVSYFISQDIDGNPVDFSSAEYFITNPGPSSPTIDPFRMGAQFDQPIHDYDAVEITADKRFADNWSLQASYRWSRLHGNFEGFFRNDNGQSDPSITSLFDFPNNDPSYTAIGVPQFGFKGDISLLGTAGAGPLPNDRPHQLKIFGNYTFDNGLNIGLGILASSGTPLTTMAANPLYDNAGEIPEGVRGSGVRTVEGFKRRTPFLTDVSVHADYALELGVNRLELIADVFNLFDTQTVTGYDYYSDVSFSVSNPDFGNIVAYQVPRQVRLGVRFRF